VGLFTSPTGSPGRIWVGPNRSRRTRIHGRANLIHGGSRGSSRAGRPRRRNPSRRAGNLSKPQPPDNRRNNPNHAPSWVRNPRDRFHQKQA